METKHWLLLVGIIGGFGTAIIALPNWEALATPAVVGGLLVSLSSSIGAVFVGKPESADTNVTFKK